jgi:hypothetical protein
MRKRICQTEVKCDCCGSDLSNSDKIVRRSIILKIREDYVAISGEDLDFCDLDCSIRYLEKVNGERYVFDNEIECPLECVKGFCRSCVAFDSNYMICRNNSYWLDQNYRFPVEIRDFVGSGDIIGEVG